MLESDRAWFIGLISISSEYHNDNSEVNIALICQGEKQQTTNTLVILSADVQLGSVRYTDSSMFRQFDIPTVRYSDSSIFRQFDIPTVRYSDSSIFRQFDIPTVDFDYVIVHSLGKYINKTRDAGT